jgi:uncharacterized protein (TIGR02646 family)
MRRLYRDPVSPLGLTNYRHGSSNWALSSPTPSEREEIWAKLLAMQGEYCAYCEGPMPVFKRHIEHFRQRSRYPQGTFDWHNLFGSCNRQGTCGDHKDKCGKYSPQDLIKPDIEDPELFFVFTTRGDIKIRANLTPENQRRAVETIRILALDGALNQIRYSEVQGYLQTAEQFAEFAKDYPQDEWLPLLEEEIKNITNMPFATAIKHVLTRQS